MKIIIDTHIFLWSLSDPEKIDESNLREIESQANQIFVSSISIAELMIKSSLNKIHINFDPVEMAKKSGFDLLDFSSRDALLLRDLPYYHKDPFDRMLIAQSIANRYHIMSDDKKFALYDCRVM
ncbi:MAG TPA: type II toxin-antitoxin system VapC family toxin [Spirochaetota bacterium]|nr:type II toxin-antitoxin system VapC family toxin [Spirochaetota bacterium]HPJ40061.1 type II toxin-antitoxin system VapC family toxin [Spirochaetota bacterium]HPQ54385.1 type II toxin-antitoxin system VapC family toxin [Spirochaetota bacterium]